MEKGFSESNLCMCAEVFCRSHPPGHCQNPATETRNGVIVWRLCVGCHAEFKKSQQKVIDEIKTILRTIGEQGF